MLYVVGVGPGDPEYITLKALRTLERCAVVAGWRSVVERLPLDGKEVVYLTYQNQEAELRRLAEASLGRDVCIAVHGDPAVSDWELMRRIRSLGVPYEVVSQGGVDLLQHFNPDWNHGYAPPLLNIIQCVERLYPCLLIGGGHLSTLTEPLVPHVKLCGGVTATATG
ncbi:MAG: SAM-dependent methyltransferase [Pyrobaculum sp.]